jgi:hypothetical protein
MTTPLKALREKRDQLTAKSGPHRRSASRFFDRALS